MSTLSPDQMLCFSLYAASHAMQQAYRPLLEPHGLTYPQFIVMSALWQRDQITVRELGQKVYLESNTLTPLIKRLEARGLVLRQRDTEDERKVRVGLTPDGVQLQKETEAVTGCFLSKTGMTTEAAEMLRDQVQALHRHLLEGNA